MFNLPARLLPLRLSNRASYQGYAFELWIRLHDCYTTIKVP